MALLCRHKVLSSPHFMISVGNGRFCIKEVYDSRLKTIVYEAHIPVAPDGPPTPVESPQVQPDFFYPEPTSSCRSSGALFFLILVMLGIPILCLVIIGLLGDCLQSGQERINGTCQDPPTGN